MKSQVNVIASCLLGLAVSFILPAQVQSDIAPASDDPQRTAPAEPFRIVDNIYFVGARIHNPVFLISTSDGLILLDSSYENMVPEILEHIKTLGFEPEDIKLLLATHAHHDHVGGHALMRETTGVPVLSMAGDVEVIETGGKADFREGDPWQPAKVDRVIEDLEEVRLGDTVMTAHLTPGHTKGCTTWTMTVEENGREYDVVFVCGARMNTGEPLLDNPDYPEMAQDLAYTFAKLKILPVDFFLGGHGYWFALAEKIERMKAGTRENPFIDPEGYRQVVESWEDAYLQQLKEERGK